MQKVSWDDLHTTGNTLISPAYKSNGHVFTSGSTGKDSNGQFPSDPKAQTHLAIKHLEKVLQASGSSLEKVLKVLLFIADPKDAAAINSVYKLYFPNKPARSCVVVKFPNSDIKVEMECVAEYESYQGRMIKL
ncbi:hypothetical protein OGAPHI_000566 [Ogataea philodendri]|uniref:Uncharacterized protein n=1 Tax=Ogataea philodendri TaxID=1378263 RepID=A0A9P8T9G8_9ASCO|nr:uncharacterized protein OGAPHI_000566 [Ogataea philodendri]KAH3671343.1 hypothetical protein OGAPHI_000566 [Ogataea philodendri]